MSIRRDPIYIETDVWRTLRLLAKSYHDDLIERGNYPNTITTPDFIANQILRETIKEKYPALIDGLKELDKKEKELIESLRKNETLD